MTTSFSPGAFNETSGTLQISDSLSLYEHVTKAQRHGALPALLATHGVNLTAEAKRLFRSARNITNHKTGRVSYQDPS